MKAAFNEENGEFLLAFDPGEEAISFLEVFCERERGKGKEIPDFIDASFFEILCSASEEKWVRFNYRSFEFAFLFLVELCSDIKAEGSDTSSLESLLRDVQKWRFGDWESDSFTTH